MTLLELITGQRTIEPRASGLGHFGNDDHSSQWLLDRVQGFENDRKWETLVDAKLKGNYDVDEVEQLFQVALLCTQDSYTERPKMSEVVRMLEGDGLAEKWEQWKKEETYPQEFNNNNMHLLNAKWIELEDSTEHILPDELSGPR